MTSSQKEWEKIQGFLCAALKKCAILCGGKSKTKRYEGHMVHVWVDRKIVKQGNRLTQIRSTLLL